MSRRKGLTPELRAEMRQVLREVEALPAREIPSDEDLRCMECGGVTRCSEDGEEHKYYTARDAARPAVTVSPMWRDPMIAERAP